MPKGKTELENEKATDQTSEQAPDLKDEDDLDAAEQVQAVDLRETDRSKLVEDPKGPAPQSVTGPAEENKPPEKPAEKPPEKPAEKPSEKPADKPSGKPAEKPPEKPAEKPPSKDDKTPPPPKTPAPVPVPPDKYQLLKKDLSTLSPEEKGKRAELLTQKYVTDWKTKKEDDMKELTTGLADNEKSKEETRKSVDVPESKAGQFFDFVDKLQEGGDMFSDIAGGIAATGSDIADAAYSQRSEADNESNPGGTSGNIVGIATGGWGALSNTYGSFRSGFKAADKSKKGDSRGAKLAGFDTASSIFGAASGAMGMGGNIAGLCGDSGTSGLLSITSGFADSAGALTKMFKSGYQKKTYGDLANRKETDQSKRKMAGTERNEKEKYKRMKAAYHGNEEGSHSKEKKMEMLKARHDHKRSKDFMEAMSSAQANAQVKSDAANSGIFSGSLGAMGSGLNLMASSLKLLGPGGKIAGAILGGIGNLLKMSTHAVNETGEAKEKAARKSANETNARKYIQEKTDSLLAKPDAQADHLTGEEAKSIVAKRLGAKVPIDFTEVYKKLSERRADRILNKEEGYEEVLAAMGLSADADKATILEALGVS